MAFDKAKAVSAAEKYLTQGKIAAAVQEYRRIVEADEGDYTALNTLGDLYIRLDKQAEAVECFIRVADHYREQGFALKAIAIYKKVARLRPDELAVAQKLATLYEQQGLIVEARAQYLFIADACMRAGRARDALEALRRTADLDPQNADIRLRLAEGFMRESMRDEAAGAFAEAGTRLHARGDYKGALRAFVLAHDLRPYSHEILQGLVDANLALGATEEAAAVLEEAAKQTPDDPELQAMLARVYLDAEDAPAADRAAERLVAADRANYPLLFEVAQLYLQQGDAANAVRALTQTVEPALAKRQEKPLLELLNTALARDPENIDALRLLLRIYTWQRDDDRMRIALERLAEAAQAQELFEEERNALEHLVRLVPFDQSYAERLCALNDALGMGLGGYAGAGGTRAQPDLGALRAEYGTAPAESAPAPVVEPFSAEPFAPLATVEPQAHEGPFAGSFAETYVEPGGTPAAPAADPAASFGDLFETNSVAAETFVAPAQAATPAAPAEFEWNAGAPPGEARPADPSASFADLNDALADDAPAPAAVEFNVPAASAAPDEQEIHVTDALDAQAFAAATPAPAASAERVAALLAQELESVDFYLAQGYTDIARDTLDMLERQYGASPDIDARRAQLPAAPAASSAASGSSAAPTSSSSPAPAEDFDDAFAFQLPTAPANGAQGNGASANGASAPHANGAQPQAARAEAQTRAALDSGLAAVFDEFRSSVEEESEPASAEDYETHYNTGLAYMEMGLLDMAVEEFQAAAALATPGDGTPRFLQCCNLLGHCFMQQGLPRAAVIWFKKGLGAHGHTEAEYQALRFELANAYEELGDLDRAVDTYQEVYGIDVSYRGVADKLRELQTRRAVLSSK
ncbi:MAG TPA: tetratricopeptide repeat protein [Pyrinomonadaceae bacterium]|jgi:tetratricopeptide (TPR) repeat protein